MRTRLLRYISHVHSIRPLKRCLAVAAASLSLAVMSAIAASGQTASGIVTEFKYGSVGTEETVGVPYWLWVVLPEVFADKLPNRPGNGYERLGFIYETPTSDLPIGASRGGGLLPRVGLNCATCHAGSYRDAPGASPAIVLGMPAHQMDLQAYARFLSAIAKDPRFNAETLIPAMQKHHGFGFFDGLVYRFFAIPRTKEGILERDKRIAWFDTRPPQGPGRVDTFNPYKAMFAEAKNFEIDDTVGTADLPSLWNQRMRQGLWLHWDGNNNSVDERNKSAAIGAGATPDSLDLDALDRVANWILDLKPPAYPAARINTTLAAAGAPDLPANCANCHDIGQPRVGQTIDIAEIGTDPERLRSFTPELVHADEHHRHGKAVALLAFPEDERLCRHAARRHLAARAVSPQRLGADAAGAPVPRRAARAVLSRATTSTTGAAWASSRPDPKPRSRASNSTRRCAATATAAIPTAASCRSRTVKRCSSISRRSEVLSS